MRVKCRIVKTVYSNEEYRVFGCMLTEPNKNVKLSRYGNFTLAGEYSFLDEGNEYELDIEEGKTNKYGTQYIVKAVPSMQIEELTDDNEVQYLEQITTPQQAINIHKAYPNFIRLILNGEEDKIDTDKIYNVGEYRLGVYIREIQNKFKFFALMTCFPQYKLTISDAKDISMKFPSLEEAKEYISEHPYSALIECLGRGFESSDKLIINHDKSLRESSERCEFMLLWLLGRNEMDGNTRIYANALIQYILDYAKEMLISDNVSENTMKFGCVSIGENLEKYTLISPILAKKIKDVAIKSDRIYYDDKTKDMAKMDTYVAECNIADVIKHKLKCVPRLDIAETEQYREIDGFKSTDTQFSVLDSVINNGVSVLAGFGGSGKTTSIKMLIRMLEDNKLTYVILTPTGASAKVASKATGRSASTIHKMLAHLDGGIINADVVIVDEMSMVGVDLMNNLLNHIDLDNTRLLLSGDPAQLNSISCGLVFKDIIDSGIVPITLLNEIFRYKDGGVIKVATDIRQGKSFFESDDTIQHYGNNLTFIKSTDNQAMDIVMDEFNEFLSQTKHYNIMVLTPMNVGELGTYNINKRIQAEINPPVPSEKTMVRRFTQNHQEIVITFRKGDLILNVKNDYKALTLEEYERLQKLDNYDEFDLDESMDTSPYPNYVSIVNGDRGIIRSIDDKKMVVQIDEMMIVFTKDKIHQLLHGWCISVHKSQGQGNDYVIDVSAECHGRMLNRELLYVAVTRSSKKMTIIGSMQSINDGIMISSQDERYTFLKELLDN